MIENENIKLENFLMLDTYNLVLGVEFDNTLIELGINLSGKKDIYERRSATLLGWLSDIGGLNDAFKLILSPLIGVVSAITYSLSITND